MAYTIENNYTGNASTTLYSFTFPYLDTTDIKVSLDGVAQTLTTHYTLASPTQISFGSAPGSGVAIRIYRDTDISNLQSEFFSGSAVRAQDLNNDFNQTLYVSQETEKAVEGKWNNTTDTIDSTEAFADVNTKLMTAAAIDDRIVANIAAPALANGKIWAGNGSGVGAQVTPSGDVTMANTGAFTIANTSVETGMIANDAIDGTKLADNAINSEHYAADSIDTEHYAPNSVDTAALAADCVTAAEIADNSVNSEHYVDGSIDAIHIAADAITASAIADDAITSDHYVNASINTVHLAADVIISSKIADNAVGTEHIAKPLTFADDEEAQFGTGTDLKILHNGTDSVIRGDSIKLQKKDGTENLATFAADGAAKLFHNNTGKLETTAAGVTVHGLLSATLIDDAIDSGHYVDGSIDHAHLSNDCIDGDNIQDDAVAAEHIASNAVVNASVAAGAAIAHSKLAAVPDTQILVGNGSTVPTAVAVSGDVTIANTGAVTIAANAVEIGMIGCEQTTISDSDSHIPTSGAVVDYVASIINPIGGLEVIADDESFPNTIPAAGVVISITDCAGLSVNSSGVSTNGDALDNSTITINGFPSELRGGVGGNADPYVFASGAGLMVVSTGSSQTYNYHQAMIREADFVQLSDDINDFNSRYRIGTRTANNSNTNDDGDLFFDTGTNKMYVYDGAYDSGGAWAEVTSAGDYKYLTIKDHDQAVGGSGPTFNGSNEEFDLFDGSSDSSITSAAQLLVVLNGVLQKPNTGTFSGSEEGFYLNDTHGIKFCDPPASGSTLYVTQIGTATTLSVPADGSVTAAKIGAGAVIAAKIGTGAVETAKLAADAVDGTKLADNACDSEHYTDGSIDTAHIADNQITLAKMAGGTDGQIITYDASGDPVAVGPGTDGQVLTSTGAGSPPAFEALPASGVTVSNNVNNRVVTGDGSNLNAEAGLTCDGTHLSITDGDLVIATAGHGVDFSANTQSSVSGVSMGSELLDWYEEGTFTPTFLDWGSQTAGNSTAGSENGGKYTRIGNTVFINLLAHATENTGSSGNRAAFYIGGLPFTQDTSTFGTSFHLAMDGVVTDSGHGSVHGIQQSNSQQFRVMSSDYDAPTATFGPNLPNATIYVYATFHYRCT